MEFMSRELQTLENPIVADWHEHKAGAHLWRWWERKQDRGPELCQQTHGMRVHIQPNGLRREGSNEDMVGASVIANKIISFSGRTSLKKLESITDLKGMKQFHGCTFPRDPAVFLSLLTNYACNWRDKASLTWNKQAKSGQRVGYCKLKLISLQWKADMESS